MAVLGARYRSGIFITEHNSCGFRGVVPVFDGIDWASPCVGDAGVRKAAATASVFSVQHGRSNPGASAPTSRASMEDNVLVVKIRAIASKRE
jgi:hypothetical protein